MTTSRYHLPDGHPRQCGQPGCTWVRTHINPNLCSKHYNQWTRGNLGRDVEGERHAGDETWIPEDGIFDELAVRIAVGGTRIVRLSTRERLEATRRILDQGGDEGDIRKRLGISKNRVKALKQTVRRERNKDQAA